MKKSLLLVLFLSSSTVFGGPFSQALGEPCDVRTATKSKMNELAKALGATSFNMSVSSSSEDGQIWVTSFSFDSDTGRGYVGVISTSSSNCQTNYELTSTDKTPIQ